MLELLVAGVIAVFVIGLIFGVIDALLHTNRGVYIIVMLPTFLCVIAFNFAWDEWSATYDICFPNPLSPDGFIYDFIADTIGGKIDSLFGVHFFAKAFGWIISALDYVVLLTMLHYWFYEFYLSDLSSYFRKKRIKFLLFICWLAFFHYMFYMRKGADWGLSLFTMPEDPKNNFISYYWVSVVLSLLIVRNEIYSYGSGKIGRITNYISNKTGELLELLGDLLR
ncbi:MAG: hypothetical protein IJK21_06375 [Prevotella sp.]|nr:hypothetical protein [Prevotella sp.]